MKVEIKNNLADMASMIKDITKDVVTNISYAVENRAKENCGPANTGALRRSIQTSVGETSDGVEGRVGTDVEYAPYLHEGTGIYSRTGTGRKDVPWVYYSPARGSFFTTEGIKPRPFLSDALEEISNEVEKYI